MTKQDYEALAALIKVHRPDRGPRESEWADAHVEVALDELARDMAQYMSRNPHFDQAKFLAAAGVQ